MIKALLLLINPVATWDGIVEARRSMGLILAVYLLPLLLCTAAGEFYGLTHWGKQRGEFGKVTLVSPMVAVQYEVVRAVLALAVVFIGTQIIAAIGRSLNPRHDYLPAFTLVAYAAGPLFLAQLLHALPFMPWWIVWIIGATLTAAALYQGVPRVIQPDPPQTIGLYFMSVITLTCLSLLAAFLASKFLTAQIKAAARSAATLVP
jgi:hypothetical protein